ncbi:MAG: PepSY domain-containing protein [Oscillospiraceae bacterium]|nr:PepSY domain-containing protein [Oscillospiraceae bacterium]
MTKRIMALALALILVFSLAACGGKAISAQKAQQIAAKDAGVKVADAENIHTHVETDADGVPYYNIHFSADGENYNYMISASGEILSVSNEAGH